MSHSRFELGFTRNRKVFSLSDAAFRLWVSAIDHCREQGTNGRLEPIDLDAIPRCPSKGKRRSKVTGELVEAGLWIKTRGGWEIHDFLDWQDDREEIEKKRAAARERMRRLRARQREQGDERSRERSTEQDSERSPTRSREVRSGGRSREREGDPPTPQRTGHRPDPLLDSLTGKAPGQRPDVGQVHEAWKRKFGYENAKFRGPQDLDAITLAEAIDANSLDDCLLVVDEAPNDRMVNGDADERGQSHDTIRYIFGNGDAFNRILRAAKKRRKESSKRGIDDTFEAAMNEEPAA